MATELKTTLELDVKPFLDAIRRVANNLKVLEDVRPRINVNEFQRNIQASLNQIRGLNPEINVGLNVDTRELTDVRNQIDTIGQDPVNVELLVNSEEIVTSLNRIRDLRQTAVSIPPQTKLDVDTNAEEAQTDIGNIKTDATDLTKTKYLIQFDVNDDEIITRHEKFRDVIQQVIQPLVVRTDSSDLEETAQELSRFRQIVDEPINFDLAGSEEEIARLKDVLSETLDILSKLKETGTIDIEPNTEQIELAFKLLEEELNTLQQSSRNLDLEFNVDKEGLIQFQQSVERVRGAAEDIAKINVGKIFPDATEQQIQEILNDFRDLNALQDAIDNDEIKFNVNQEELDKLFLIGQRLDSIPKQLAIEVVAGNVDNVIDKFEKLKTEANKTDSENVNISSDVQNFEQTDRELKTIKKDADSIPKNVKINVDSSGIGGASKALSGVSGFGKQLGSGLLASFSGAAIGAAIANFASQAVRAIVSASDKADELNDKLKLAFTQAGALPGLELDKQLQNANVFALDLADNFGISINRSKELLAQVTGLTGEFGATSEAITKASIGIEEATGGLVKAETAAKLFSRSIGNPEDQAALETLAKRFPAIGEAIQSATDPAEKANAVISNLAGTFTALEEKSRGFGEQFQILSEVAFSTFAAGLVPIFDAFVPILESFRKLITDNADAIAQFGQQIVTNFVNPLVEQLLALGPQFGTFFEGLFQYFSILGGVSFDVFTTTLSILAPILETVGNLLIALSPLVQQLADIVSAALVPIFQAFNNELYNSLDPTKQLTDNVFSLNPIIETLSNLVELLNPIMNIFGFIIVNTVIPAVQGLEYALGFALIPFRLFNGAFELGKKLADDFGVSINSLAIGLSKAALLLGPLGSLLSAIIPGIAQIAQTPVQTGGLVRGLGTAAKGFGDLNGLVQNSLQGLDLTVKSTNRAGGGLKNLSGATKENSKAIADNRSEIEKLSAQYDILIKQLQNRYDIEELSLDLAFKTKEARSLENRTVITEYKSLQEELDKINLREQERIDTLKILGQTYIKVSKDAKGNPIVPEFDPKTLKQQVEEYLGVVSDLTSAQAGPRRTLDPSVFGIAFDAKDPKSVEEAKKVAERIVELYKEQIKNESDRQEFEIRLSKVDFQIDQQAFTDRVQEITRTIDRQFRDLELGKISVAQFDIDGLRKQIDTIKSLAQNGIKPYADEIRRLQLLSKYAQDELNRLAEKGIRSGDAVTYLQGVLRNSNAELQVINGRIRVFTDALADAEERSLTLGDAIEQSINQNFDRLAQRQEFQINLDLNAEGVRQGLIDIETNFARSVNNIQKTFAAAEARLRIEQNVPVGPLLQSEKLAKAQKEALRTIAAENLIAIQQFKQQNDAVFALTQALSNNLGQAFVPNTLDARRGLNERQKQIDSQLELLRANLDAELQLNKDNLQLRTLSYQEYTEKVLELEKEKSESIKQYEEEVSQARLQALQKIADEALPAIQNQLLLANAELTVLFQDSTATFEEVANKGLETIGLVAAQSLALAVQQAKSLEDIQKLFLRNLASGILKLLRIQLEAAILQALFKEISEKSFAGIVTGAIISGVLVGLFAAAEAKILASIGGFESGGYTGDRGTKEVAGFVHGQEFVVNAKGTKGNRDLLEWLNKGKSAESFFNSKPNELNVNNFVDTKSLNASINGLAYTMDARLSSMERTLDSAITKNAMTVRTANQVDVSVYSDPGTAVKYMKKMGKIKGLT